MKNRAQQWWKPALCGVSMLLGAALPVHAADVYVALVIILDEAGDITPVEMVRFQKESET